MRFPWWMPVDLQLQFLVKMFEGNEKTWQHSTSPKLEEIAAKMADHSCVGGIVVVPKNATKELALEKYIALLSHDGQFVIKDHLADKSMGMEHDLRFTRYTQACSEFYFEIESLFPGDFMALPIRLGEELAHLSPFEARQRIMKEGNFPLDPISVLSFFYTHHRMLDEEVMCLNALAVEVSPKGNEKFEDACYVDRLGKKVHNLDWNWEKRVRDFRTSPYIVTRALP